VEIVYEPHPHIINCAPSLRIYGDPIPCFPFPLMRGRGKILKRGAVAPLRHPYIVNQEKGESKRGEASKYAYRE